MIAVVRTHLYIYYDVLILNFLFYNNFLTPVSSLPRPLKQRLAIAWRPCARLRSLRGLKWLQRCS